MIRDQKPELLEPKAMRISKLGIFSSKKGGSPFSGLEHFILWGGHTFFQKIAVRFPLRDD